MKVTTVLFLVFATATSAHAAVIEMVYVGNPGNAPDAPFDNTQRGAVNYEYQIGKYEVTAGQYTEFLNAVAKDDPNQLYSELMSDPTAPTRGANIQRTGTAANYSYSVAPDWANRPVNYVSFWDAVRFANWLHNGQTTGLQGPGTTETGAYHDVENQALFGRNVGGGWLIPSVDEWYKAAFHKNDSVTGNYWDYATQSDTVPSSTLPDTGNNATYQGPHGTFTIGSPYWRTEVGTFTSSESAYGTFDQSGNVYEWNDTAILPNTRGTRGGGFEELNTSTLGWTFDGSNDPYNQNTGIGFRVAFMIAEPATYGLVATATLVLFSLRRKSVPHGRD
jgi:sulfatase modifying factor 1